MDEATRAVMLSPDHPEDVLSRAEADGYENMKGRLETAQWIAGQAATTLTVLLAGIGGSLAYAVEALQGSAGHVEKGRYRCPATSQSWPYCWS